MISENQTFEEERLESKSFIVSMLNQFFIEPTPLIMFVNLNLAVTCIAIFILVAGYSLSSYYLLIYIPLLLLFTAMRKSREEKMRLEISHRIPFFAETIANSLQTGASLEQAFIQGAYFLKGKIKNEFIKLTLKNRLGKNINVILREIDAMFPNTGLMYLISLLDAYSKLGVGISPLLKRIALVLTNKEKAEDKIRVILAGGSNYAKMTVCIFGAIFLTLFYLMQDQVKILWESDLRPVFLFLTGWMLLGIVIVMRITSLGFTRNFALKPYIDKFLTARKLNFDDLLSYSGIKWTKIKKQMLFIAPVLAGFVGGYITSWYFDDEIIIFISICFFALICWFLIKFIIQGHVEDQLISTVEIFPEILQIFIIGLNSGLNVYLAFQFALNSIKGNTPVVLMEELNRIQMAMECGEDPKKSWKHIAHRLPFETIIDFTEIMIVAPLHGESIVNAITQMTNGYQEKKLLLIEKKATTLSQVVIPVIILAFLPLFLFVMFAPIISKIKFVI